MGLKILHSADWHLGAAFSAVREDRRSELRAAQREIPGYLAQVVRAQGVQLVLLAGDLFEGNPSGSWVRLVKQALEAMEVPVCIAPGNHDPAVPGSPWLEERWPENVHIFTGGLCSIVLPELSCRVYGAGYRSMDCPPLLEHFRAEGAERHCVAVLHGDPLVRSSPCCPVTAAQVLSSGLDYLALGHIHKAGSFTAGSTLCAWPGCAMGRGWDETGEKGAYLVELEDTAQAEFFPIPGIRFHDLTVDVEQTAPEAVLPPAATRDFYRLTLTGMGEVDAAAVQRQFSHIPNLRLIDRTGDPGSLWESAGEDSLRGMYFSLLQHSQDPRRELAARISRQLLLGEEVTLP